MKLFHLFNQIEISNCSKQWGIKTDKGTEDDTELNMELWDFAGQTQYYGLHQAFLTKVVFLLSLLTRHQQSPYDWLQQIDLLARKLPQSTQYCRYETTIFKY